MSKKVVQRDMEDILSDEEVELLEEFTKEKTKLNAVKKVLLACVYENGTLKPDEEAKPYRNFALNLVNESNPHNPTKNSNEEIGERLRAAWEGIKNIEEGFKTILQYEPDNEDEQENENPAR